MNRVKILERLMKEDKSGLAYCLNQMMGVNGFGYHHYCSMLKTELRNIASNATDDQLTKLKDFQTYKHLFE